jgi:acyl carrier protein
MDEIESKVRAIIRERLDVTEQQMSPTADLMQDLGADSLDVAEIVMHLEETCEIEIPDEDVPKIRTVQQVVDYVRTRVSQVVKKD